MFSDSFKQLSYLQIVGLLVFFRLFCVLFYRLYLHPLKAFPGPRLAAITGFYQGYFDSWKDGMLVAHLAELHKLHGPVVRIAPNELHFSSPEAYFAIYPPHSGFTKDPAFYACFGVEDSTLGITDVEEHKKRRDILNPLFSRRAILKLENVVQKKVDLLMDRMRSHHAEPVNLFRGFKCLAMDIITTYSYAHSFNGLATAGFAHRIPHSMQGAIAVMTATRYFPILRVLHQIPDWLGVMINPDLGGLAYMKAFLEAQVDGILKNPEILREADHETIYHRLITPELIKLGQVPSKKALIEEAILLLIAGTDTSSNAMTVGFFHLLSNELVKKKLKAELKAAWPEKDTPFSYEMLEKLPLLTGVIKEGLRLSIGVPIPLMRVTTSPTIIDGTAVPAGTIVGVGQPFVLKNPDIFPDPETFKPERWMQPDSQKLDKYLVAFSKGPRSCLGLNLAWCQLYLTFGHLMRKFDMQLFETTKEDMAFREHGVPIWRMRPLKVLVQEVAE
ncbi:cytochrome P450 [Hymenopellis radicata]|nr:cytochrome P450 [Hymenopellis radicata]